MTTVIGIDPGSQRTGWGVVSEQSGQLSLVECGIIRSSSKEECFSERLAKIYHELSGIIARLKPSEAGIEQVFVAKYSQSALKLGQARGVAVAACAQYGLPVSDYEPTMVKKALVGTGKAEKEQVAFMVKTMLKITSASWPLDTSDALGVAICHLSVRKYNQSIAIG